VRSLRSIIDYVSVIPAYFAWALNFSGAGFLRVLAIARVARILQTLQFVRSLFIRALIRLILSFVIIVFIFSCLLLLIEPLTFGNWHTAAYFTFVSLTTVGFGDLSARTDVGRWVVVLLITACVVVIPLQGFWLSAASASEKQRQRAIFKFNSASLTVLVLLPRGFKETLFRIRTFVQEFFRRVRPLCLSPLFIAPPTSISQYHTLSTVKIRSTRST
jgi:hypothetical protein